MKNNYLSGLDQIENLNLDKLTKLIDSLLHKNEVFYLPIINKILSKNYNLNEIVTKIINDDKAFYDVLDNSYKHENGFHKLVLLSGKSFKLRMHVFGRADEVPMENVHDHRWNFSSSIIKGSLKMEMYEINDNKGISLFHYKYNSNKSENSYQVDYLGKKRVNLKKLRVYSEGDSYFMQTNEFHRITNKKNEECITLIMTGNPISNECNLLSKNEFNLKENILNKYEEYELRNLLMTLIVNHKNAA
jgi:hypothetical protein